MTEHQCPSEWFVDERAARLRLVKVLTKSPREPYQCRHCGYWHLKRSHFPRPGVDGGVSE
jgi:hypothetical protein